jgi:hypothetical protein
MKKPVPSIAAYIMLSLGVVLALFALVTLIKQRDNTIKAATSESLSAVITAQRKNCQGDHKFRIQYKRRGAVEKKLLELFLDLSRTQVKDPSLPAAQRQQARAFIKEFQPLTNRLKIIPLPRCNEQIVKLKRAINRAIQ